MGDAIEVTVMATSELALAAHSEALTQLPAGCSSRGLVDPDSRGGRNASRNQQDVCLRGHPGWRARRRSQSVGAYLLPKVALERRLES